MRSALAQYPIEWFLHVDCRTLLSCWEQKPQSLGPGSLWHKYLVSGWRSPISLSFHCQSKCFRCTLCAHISCSNETKRKELRFFFLVLPGNDRVHKRSYTISCIISEQWCRWLSSTNADYANWKKNENPRMVRIVRNISRKCADNERKKKLGRFPIVRKVQIGDTMRGW